MTFICSGGPICYCCNLNHTLTMSTPDSSPFLDDQTLHAYIHLTSTGGRYIVDEYASSSVHVRVADPGSNVDDSKQQFQVLLRSTELRDAIQTAETSGFLVGLRNYDPPARKEPGNTGHDDMVLFYNGVLDFRVFKTNPKYVVEGEAQE